MKVIKTKSILNNLHWYSGTKHCLKDYQDAWFFVTVSEVISLKYSLGLVSISHLKLCQNLEADDQAVKSMTTELVCSHLESYRTLSQRQYETKKKQIRGKLIKSVPYAYTKALYRNKHKI